MRWVSLGVDGLLVCFGVLMLLYAYRLIGKPPGADPTYDAAMGRQAWLYKLGGWCVTLTAVIGLLADAATGGLW
jgi:hypothetical protein